MQDDFYGYDEHISFEYATATETELDRAEARELGELKPEQCWILTDRDVWHKNPFYEGEETPHPESYDE